MYKLKDFLNEDIKGNFYASELQKVNKNEDSLWFIDSPHYHHVKTNIVYDIEIYITTEKDQLGSFLNNTSTVTLHFKSFPFFFKYGCY